MNVCIDDVKGETLTSSNFTALVKGIYKGVPRTKMLPYGKGVEYINTCSPLAYSTNESLPDLKEVINRMNIVEIFGKVFKADKFKYHEVDKDNNARLKELSLILPQFLKYSTEDVIKLYEQVFEILKENVKDTQNRVINNIAYAYTGALMLLTIANIAIEDLHDKVIEYAQKQITAYENIQTPVEKVFESIIVLTKLGIFQAGTHFRIMDVEIGDNMETHLRFHKDVVLSAINKYYAHDKSKRINESQFLNYAKNHSRFRDDNCSVRYDNNKSKVVASMCFNITGLDDFVSISKTGVIMPASADELRAKLNSEGNNM